MQLRSAKAMWVRWEVRSCCSHPHRSSANSFQNYLTCCSCFWSEGQTSRTASNWNFICLSLTTLQQQLYMGATGGFGNRTLSFQETTCQWMEQLQPENRTDGFGIGWLNMHTIEAMETATADELQVSAQVHRLDDYEVLICPSSICQLAAEGACLLFNLQSC